MNVQKINLWTVMKTFSRNEFRQMSETRGARERKVLIISGFVFKQFLAAMWVMNFYCLRWQVVVKLPEVSTSPPATHRVWFSFAALTILLIAHKTMCHCLYARNMVLSSFFWLRIQLLSLFISVRISSRASFFPHPRRNVSISQNK